MSKAAISFPMLGDFSINPSNYISIGGFRVYWYGIIIAFGFLLAVIYASKRAKQFGFTPDNILDVILLGVPLGIICGRLYYVIFYWKLYQNDLSRIFDIRDGGLGMYGVLFGAILALLIYSKHKKLSILAFLDLVSIGFLIGQFVGRWGNFINREAYGYETDIFCRMGLTLDGETIYVHPTFLYESLWNFAGFILIHFLSKKRKYDGQVFLMYLGWYGLGRMFIEGLRTDSLYLFNTGIRVSQLVAAISLIVSLALLLYNKFRVQHNPMDLFVNRKLAQEAAASVVGIERPAEQDEESASVEETAESDNEQFTETDAEEHMSGADESDDQKKPCDSTDEETADDENGNISG